MHSQVSRLFLRARYEYMPCVICNSQARGIRYVKAQPQRYFTFLCEVLSPSRISYPATVNEEASEIMNESHTIHLDLRDHHNEPQLETLVLYKNSRFRSIFTSHKLDTRILLQINYFKLIAAPTKFHVQSPIKVVVSTWVRIKILFRVHIIQYKHISIYTKRKINHHPTVFCSKEKQHLYLARIHRTRKSDGN